MVISNNLVEVFEHKKGQAAAPLETFDLANTLVKLPGAADRTSTAVAMRCMKLEPVGRLALLRMASCIRSHHHTFIAHTDARKKEDSIWLRGKSGVEIKHWAMQLTLLQTKLVRRPVMPGRVPETEVPANKAALTRTKFYSHNTVVTKRSGFRHSVLQTNVNLYEGCVRLALCCAVRLHTD